VRSRATARSGSADADCIEAEPCSSAAVPSETSAAPLPRQLDEMIAGLGSAGKELSLRGPDRRTPGAAVCTKDPKLDQGGRKPVMVPCLAWWVLLLLAVVGAEIVVLAFFRGARNVSRSERRHAVAEARRQARQD
jgi:hypothetical protein